MRIAFDARVAQGKPRGMGVYAINLLRAMGRRTDKPEITLLLDSSRPDPVGVDLQTFHVRRLSPFGGTIGWEQMTMGGVTGFDLLHCPANAAPMFSRISVVVTIHDAIFMRKAEDISDVPYFAQTVGHYYRTMCYPKGARKAGGVITVSQASKAEIILKMGVKPEKITVTPEAVSEAFASANVPAESDLLPRLGLTKPYMLAMGAYEKRKNIGLLFRVWEALKKSGSAVPLLALSGAENLKATRYEAEVRERGIADLVRFLPYLPDADLKGLHTYAEAFLMPSRNEGFGLPPLEAMSVGTPVIASNIPAHSEVCGDAALLLDPDDLPGWVAAIGRSDLRTAFRESGLRRSGLFSWDACATGTLQAWSRLSP